MRPIIALAYCLLMLSSQVHACRGPSHEYSLFFVTIPDPQPDADVIAKVSLLDVNLYGPGTATANVLQVLKTSDTRVHEGDRIAMKYMLSSCGPKHKNGDEGTITAKTGTDSAGHLVLYPHLRRKSDGLFIDEPPRFISN